MATTCQLIELLQAGVRDPATGLVVASGKVRFYEPGTLTPKAVYLNQDAVGVATVPLTLSAYGQAQVYILGPTRMLVKDSTETTTYLDVNIGLTRTDTTYLTAAGYNGGAETTLKTVLDNAYASFGGTDWRVLPAGGTVPLTMLSFANGVHVDARAFGAVGDNATDCRTALQNGINHVQSLGGGTLYLPAGIYRISGVLSITAAGVTIRGAGSKVTFIRGTNATAGGINYTVTSGGATAFVGLTVDHVSASTGYGIEGLTSGVASSAALTDVGTSGYNRGFYPGDGETVRCYDCTFAGSAFSTYIVSGAATFAGCRFDTATVFTGSFASFSGCEFTAATGITLSSLGRVCVTGSEFSCTTDFSNPNRPVYEFGNSYGSFGEPMVATDPGSVISPGGVYGEINTTAATVTFSPAFAGQSGCCHYRATAAGITVTIDNPGVATTGTDLVIMCQNSSGGAVTWTFDSVFRTSAAVAPATGSVVAVTFTYETRNNVWRETSRATTTV